MPDEPVMTGTTHAKAYLIEVKSIAGLSGSPVFVNPPEVRVVNGHVQHRGPMLIPLGVLVGYHVVESKEDQIAVPRFQNGARDADASSPDERNTGFAVVIPIERVYDIIESPELKAIMEQQIQKRANKSGYRQASAVAPEPETKPETNPAHREDFNRLVSAASKPKPKGDRT
jgi:hypothetical protein